AFSFCKSLQTVALGNGVTSLGRELFGKETFSYCDSLREIVIPKQLTYICSNAFECCPAIEKIRVEKGNTVYHSEGNCLIETATKTLIQGCMNSKIPTDGSVIAIGDSAFEGVNRLISLSIPNAVQTIGKRAFSGCTALKALTIPEGVTKIEERTFNGCSALTEFIIPDSVTRIESGAFFDCNSLTSITIPENVTFVWDKAFDNCSALTIYCEKTSSERWVDNWSASCPVVWDCKNNNKDENGYIYAIIDGLRYALKNGIAMVARQPREAKGGDIVIPASVAYDGAEYRVTGVCKKAFWNVRSITSIVIPESVTEILEGAFSGCGAVITVNEGNSNYCCNGNCLIETKSKTLVAGCANSVIPTNGSVTKIGDHAFLNCDSITGIVIPNGVTSIGQGAFFG
ncbi:MAG: leucine-rich repeat domain-containing protein, partial [Clostridia bacterium]|nr:leucine-rich repeat domain-containing protein [Clostridia bacterium]